MVIGSFIVFAIFLMLFLFVLYFDRRNLFLGIFFIATGLSFIFYLIAFTGHHAQDNGFIYNLGVVLVYIAVVIFTLLPMVVVIMFYTIRLCLLEEKD